MTFQRKSEVPLAYTRSKGRVLYTIHLEADKGAWGNMELRAAKNHEIYKLFCLTVHPVYSGPDDQPPQNYAPGHIKAF